MSVHAQPKATSTKKPSVSLPRRPFSFFHALRFRESYCAWVFIAPALIGFFTFYLMPAFRALYISMTDWNLLRVPKFIGPANFSKLWNDPSFWNSMKVTVLYVLYNIPIQTVIGLLLAVLLARVGRSVILRSIILAPYLIANVIAAIIWFWMLDPLLGFANSFLQWIGIGRTPFFTDQHLALPTIAVVNIWRHMGLTALLFFTGMQAIPNDIYEAARIEGAGPWKSFFGITLPLIRPTMVFVLVTSIIGSFQVFDTIAVTTLGGPNYATRTIVWYIYENGFVNFRMGYASALSCALFACLTIVTLVQMRILRSGQSELG